jgi:hypothetical protein
MPTPNTQSAPADIRGILTNLDKYAGWLGRGPEPTRVREAVKLLTAMFESGCDTRAAADALESDIGRMPSSQVGTLLRKAVRGFRLAVAKPIAI